MDDSSSDDRPDWWRENASIRSMLGLPAYTPPRFEDGQYTHEVVPELEARYDVSIRFVGVDTRYGDDWEVRVDDEPALSVGRHRDSNGNTVYELTAETFRDRLSTVLSARRS